MLEKTPFNGKLRNKPVPDPVESETVRVMVQLYLGGDGAQSVARQLNERDLLHRGRPWNRDAVLSVLGNPAIAGKILWGRTDRRTGRVRPDEECIAIPLEPIIDQTTFDRIAPLA